MRKIDTDKLKKGDIILSTSTKPNSKLIRFFTNSDVSHAMLYVSNGSVMDSTSDGVQARNIQKMFYDDSCAIYAYRPVKEISEENLDKVVAYMRSETGAPYTTIEAMASVLSPSIGGGGKQFCSRLVARAYSKIGFNITENPDFTTPADIQKSKILKEITDIVVNVTDEEKKYLAEWGDKTKGMQEVTKNLMSAIRKFAPSIRVLNDIEPFLLENPEFDKEFSKAFKASGYLDFWKIEVNSFAWRYDTVLLVQFYHACEEKEAILKYCKETVRHHEEGDFAHWEENLKRISSYLQVIPLETFSLQFNLYMNLCFHQEQRVTAAKILLRTYGENLA